MVADFRPRLVVELGTHSGESYFAFCQAVRESRTGTACYAVDTWKGDVQAGFYPEEVYADVFRHNQEFYADFSYLVRASFDDAVDRFVDGSVDLIHFDGLHTYEAVRHDLTRWQPKLSPRGVALFHDIAARHDDFGAWRLWEEIRREGQSFAFRHGWGLGVWKPAGGEPTGSPLLERLFAADEIEAESIRQYYILANEALRKQKAVADNAHLQEDLKAADLRAEELREEGKRRDERTRDEAAQRDELIRSLRTERDEIRQELVSRPQAVEPVAPQLQVYFSREGAFDEANSQRLSLVPERWERLTLVLPSDWKGGRLRLDPGSDFALADIAGVRIYTQTLGTEVWKLLGSDLAAAAQVGGSAQAIPMARTLRVLCAAPDPQIVLPEIDLRDYEEPLTLEIGLRLRTTASNVGRSFQELAQAFSEWPQVQARSRQLAASLDAEQAAHLSTAEALAQERAAHEEAAAALQLARADHATLPDLRRQLDEARAASTHRQEQLVDLQSELQEAQEELGVFTQAQNAMEREVAGLLAELHDTHLHLAEKDRALTEMHRQFEAKHAELLALDARLVADHGRLRSMRRSFSWKLTLPLRAMGRGLTGRTTAKQSLALPVPPVHASDGQTASSQAQQKYRFHLDKPTTWNQRTRRVKVSGWCVPQASGEPLPRLLLLRVGDQRVEVSCNVLRADVQAAYGNHSEWQFCGFEVEVTLPHGSSEVTFEAQDEWEDTQFLARFSAHAPYVDGLLHASAETNLAYDYTAWVARYDSFSYDDRRRLREQSRALPHRPLISVVMPVYNTSEQWLTKAIDSVRWQFYPFWELCIADDCSPKPHVREILRRYEQLDQRIKVVYREENGHISAASNSALEIATGEFVALLDHDDELPAHALYMVAAEINAHPSADVIYSDEDKIDEEGRRYNPYFKPDWNPDLLQGQNFVSHLGVYRREAVNRAQGFRVGFEGCQDWDLVLRVTEGLPAERVRHIPRVLYHWRAIEGSTARGIEEKDYILDTSRRVIQEHCERTGVDAEVLPVPGGGYRVRRRLPAALPLVSIIIPTHNQCALLRHGIEVLRERTTYPRYELLVVDNRSSDPETLVYLDGLKHEDGVRVLRYAKPFNYSSINNFAVAHAQGGLICLMNNDMEVITPGWLEEMVSQALRPEIGAVGALLYYPDDTIQHAGVVLGLGGVAGHIFNRMSRGTDGYFNRARLVQSYTAVTAACLLIRKTTFEEVGGLEEKNLPVSFNDADLCLKIHAAGYRNLWTPFAELYHHESASRGQEDTPEKQARCKQEVDYMIGRWTDILRMDPAHNPNISLETSSVSFADPPRLAAPGFERGRFG